MNKQKKKINQCFKDSVQPFLYVLLLLALVAIAAFYTVKISQGAHFVSANEFLNSTSKKPRIPTAKRFSVDSAADELAIDLNQLMRQINVDLPLQNITEAELRAGWYLAEAHLKKVGTPVSWNLIDYEGGAYWASESKIKSIEQEKEVLLCTDTGGEYIFSCLDSESESCELLLENTCKCSPGSQWFDLQGCILVDSEDESISITEKEIELGGYLGKRSEKKLNTPVSWVWFDQGEDSKWGPGK